MPLEKVSTTYLGPHGMPLEKVSTTYLGPHGMPLEEVSITYLGPHGMPLEKVKYHLRVPRTPWNAPGGGVSEAQECQGQDDEQDAGGQVHQHSICKTRGKLKKCKQMVLTIVLESAKREGKGRRGWLGDGIEGSTHPLFPGWFVEKG